MADVNFYRGRKLSLNLLYTVHLSKTIFSSSFTPVSSIRICLQFLSAHFLFLEIVKMNLTFVVNLILDLSIIKHSTLCFILVYIV